jgi:hypothetical protein
MGIGPLEQLVSHVVMEVAEGSKLWVVQLMATVESHWCWRPPCRGFGFAGVFVVGLVTHSLVKEQGSGKRVLALHI